MGTVCLGMSHMLFCVEAKPGPHVIMDLSAISNSTSANQSRNPIQLKCNNQSKSIFGVYTVPYTLADLGGVAGHSPPTTGPNSFVTFSAKSAHVGGPVPPSLREILDPPLIYYTLILIFPKKAFGKTLILIIQNVSRE